MICLSYLFHFAGRFSAQLVSFYAQHARNKTRVEGHPMVFAIKICFGGGAGLTA